MAGSKNLPREVRLQCPTGNLHNVQGNGKSVCSLREPPTTAPGQTGSLERNLTDSGKQSHPAALS